MCLYLFIYTALTAALTSFTVFVYDTIDAHEFDIIDIAN